MNILKLLALTSAGIFGVGCAGVGFEQAWNESVNNYQSNTSKQDPVAGPWTGAWKTDTNGHEGNLRCLVTPTATNGNYDFRYHATWFKIFRAGYKVNYDVKPNSNGYSVNGDENLGLFGTFNHDGQIQGDKFTAKYSNKKGEVGNFSMKRPSN